jgi:hypothetical protein
MVRRDQKNFSTKNEFSTKDKKEAKKRKSYDN